MKQNTKYIIIAVVVVIIAYLGYDLLKPSLSPCESIFQQTTTRISGNLETIQTKGGLVIGATRIQKLTERSQMLALNLKTCCTLADQEILSSEEFLACKNNADTYIEKMDAIAETVKEIEKSDVNLSEKEIPNTATNPVERPELNQKVQKINTLILQSEVAFKAVRQEVSVSTVKNKAIPISPGIQQDLINKEGIDVQKKDSNKTSLNYKIKDSTSQKIVDNFSPKVRTGLKKAIDPKIILGPKVALDFTACKDAVQGKIAWDYQGHKRWAAENVTRLCQGAGTSVEPARCFAQVMHGGVNWGGGTRWQWQNAIDLCEGSGNGKATISCFKEKIASGVSWPQAINACEI